MIYNKYIDGELSQKFENIFSTLKQRISIKNIVFMIFTILLTNQTFITDVSPFSFVLFAVASVFNVPLILVLGSSVLSLVINSITTVTLLKLLGFFAVFTLVTAILNIEGISKKYSVFIKFLISYIAVDLVSNFLNATLITEIFANLGNILIISILYFIFVSGMYVLLNIKKGYIHSKEETISMIIMLALTTTVFANIDVFGYSIVNILVLVIILVYGWKNGSVYACSAGLVTGLFLTCITNVSLSFVVALALSGLVAGIFSKLGKIAIIIAFVLGNVYISYYTNNFTELTMRASEILIASLSLLFIPKVLEMKFDNIFNQNRTLTKAYENILDSASDAKNKIGAISELFDSLAKVEVETTLEDTKETREVIKKYITDYIECSCIDCTSRDTCLNKKSLDITVDYIAGKLENNEQISANFLSDCEISAEMISDIKEIYANMKLTRILKQKEKENSAKLSNQYKEVSKILSNISRNIKNTPVVEDKTQLKLRDELKFYGYIVYEDEFKREGQNIEYTFVTDILTNIDKQKKQIISLASDILEQNVTIKLILNSSKKEKSRIKIVTQPDYDVQNAISHDMKEGETVSGDSYITMELQDLKQLSVLSDGAGSGMQAAKGSNTVISMLEKLLAGGFDEKKAVEIINSVIKLKGDDTVFSTLDSFIFDLKTGNAEFIKLGAAPTYILQYGRITTINNINIPVGLVKDTDYVPISKKLNNNDIVIQITDGVIPEGTNPTDNFLTKYLQTLDTTKTAKIISDDIHKLVLKENKSILTDDMTVIVTKIKKVDR